MFRRYVICLLLVLVTLAAQGQVPVEILSNNVKARKSASTKAPVLANLHKGEVFVITDDLPYWYEISLRNGKSAWVRKSACTVVDKSQLPQDSDTAEVSAPPAIAPPQPAATACVPTSVPADWGLCPATGSGGLHGQAY